MNLPEELIYAIEEEAAKFTLSKLMEAREKLTARYQQAKTKIPFMQTDVERCAYIISRMPATYAVLCRLFDELIARTNESYAIKTFLDLGAGPGTAMWAAASYFKDLQQIVLVEQDAALASFGKRLTAKSSSLAVQSAEWQVKAMQQTIEGKYDLVVLSYSAGELSPENFEAVIEKAWRQTSQFLLIVEPGTPKGFNTIRKARTQLIAWNAHLVAPCPHANACPMKEDNWCHFSQRIERSFLQRYLKKGVLGFEDEKFSYIIVSKDPIAPLYPRVLRPPQKHSGHIILNLCHQEGLKQKIVSKRTPKEYKKARKLDWGSSYTGNANEEKD